MKAVKYYGPGHVELTDIPRPEAGPGQVLVKIAYCGICGTDIHAYKMPGIFNWELILGHESVGTVEAVGTGVDCVQPGDRVAVGPPGDCGKCYSCNTGNPNTCVNAFPETLGIGPGTQGAYAEYILSRHPQNELLKIPDGVSFEDAVLFDVLGVGIHAVRYSRLKVGDCAVISGAGSIGLATIQFARLTGASRLVVFDPVESRRMAALSAGADFAFNPADPDDCARARSLLARTGGAQVCFECAGHPASVQTCVDFVMNSGQIMLIGNDGRPFELVTAALGHRQLDLQLSFTYTREEAIMLFDMIATGKLNTDSYIRIKAPLSHAEQMLKQLADGRLEVSRVLLRPDEG